MCVPSTFYERPGVVTSSSSSNNTRKYTCMSQRKLPLHKRWVTASFDALSQGKPERTEQRSSLFSTSFFLLTPQQQQKNNNLFFCDKNTSSSSSLFIIVVIIPTRSLFSPCVGEKVLLPLGPALFNYQPHETNPFGGCCWWWC